MNVEVFVIEREHEFLGFNRPRRAFRRVVVLVVVLGLLAIAGVLVVPAFGVQARRADVGARARAIPVGLVRAIHARLGPGAIGLGSAPLISGIEPVVGGWKAKAPAQSLEAQISPNGAVSAHLDGRATVSLTPVALSSGGAFAPLSAGHPSFRAGRLVVRLGAATGTYQVTAGGLEQRFTVTRPLSRAAHLTLRFRSPLSWRTIRARSAVVPRAARDGRLAYAGLRATDARGSVLRTRFAVTAGGPEIVIDTTNASYPVTIDPTWTTTSTPTATLTNGSGSRSDALGYSVALSSDGATALIGAPYANDGAGAAYVFHASAEGAWASSSTPTATLTNGSASSADHFGSSVALSSDGTTAFIGAPDPGAAYVFHVSEEGAWASSSTPTATLTNGSGGSGFGSSVALSFDGTTALIGAAGVNGASSAYIFHALGDGAWVSSSTATATLTNSSGSQSDGLGSSVALSSDGTTALIGADGVNYDRGAAYIFQASAEGSWASSSTPTATLTNRSGSQRDGLGSSVALSSDGTTALIGAPGVNDAGAAYVFHVSGEGSWASSSTPTATLTNGSEGGGFGHSVALSSDGTIALIGAPDAITSAGAAYVFHFSAEGSWPSSSTPTATLPGTGGSEVLGSSVALSSDGATALIGADGLTTPDSSGKGAAYVFTASAASPSCTLVPHGARVYVAAKHGKHQNRHKKHPPFGVLKLDVRCDQSAAVKLAGTTTAVSKPKPRSGKKHSKTKKYTISAVKAMVTAGKTVTVTVKLPKAALSALEGGAHESILFTLTSPNGVGTTTAKIARLELVRTSR